MNDLVYYAHTLEGETEEKWQTIKEHAENVAELIKKFSAPWCEKEYAENLGLLHDVGKYQADFQRRLRGEKISVEHSICGAAHWLEMKWLESGAYCIAGHHSGLPDVGNKTDSADGPTLLGRKKRAERQNFSTYKRELALKEISTFAPKNAICTRDSNADNIKKEYAFWTRVMFSCLTDADYLYLINMPTGTGKTLTSMQFALERAVLAHKKHIIYVIPYTSIIEQSAKIFKDIFGADVVLEHHCNFDYLSIKDVGLRERLQRTAENWDASIIVTTNVQFFESIYGNRSSELRKLHNIANSIIVFDEAHMLPGLFFQPCLEAVKILAQRYHCEAVFMTATMPDFHTWMREFGCSGIKTLHLIPDKSDFPIFNRCKIENLGQLPFEKLAALAAEAEYTLIVVNSPRAARQIYKLLPGKKYHLSTYMTHDDRSAVIDMDFKKAFSAASDGIDGFGFDYASYAREFRLIDENTQPLVIVTTENRKTVKPLLDEITHGRMTSMRQLQKYSIALRPYEFEQLCQAGVVCGEESIRYLDCEQYYHKEIGICFENNDAYYW